MGTTRPRALAEQGYQAKNGIKKAHHQLPKDRDRIVSLNLVVSQKAADFPILRQRKPDSRDEHDQQGYPNQKFQ